MFASFRVLTNNGTHGGCETVSIRVVGSDGQEERDNVECLSNFGLSAHVRRCCCHRRRFSEQSSTMRRDDVQNAIVREECLVSSSKELHDIASEDDGSHVEWLLMYHFLLLCQGCFLYVG
jgi:hypothetical protein